MNVVSWLKDDLSKTFVALKAAYGKKKPFKDLRVLHVQ